MEHKCEYPECEERVDSAMLFCRTHWYEVPKPERDAVWQTWMARKRAVAGGAGAGYIGAVAAHQAAKVSAIRSVDSRHSVTRDYTILEVA